MKPLAVNLEKGAEWRRCRSTKAELEKCRARLEPLGCGFFAYDPTAWIRGVESTGVSEDTRVWLCPPFKVNDWDPFKACWVADESEGSWLFGRRPRVDRIGTRLGQSTLIKRSAEFQFHSKRGGGGWF